MRALFVATAIAAALVLASVQARLEPLASAQDSEIDPRPSADAICAALDRSAAQNDLPLDFFTRLIWQESRFDPRSISHAGAQGIAQFMPETARRVGLFNPFDPIEALPKSAQLLRDLLTQFGNLGLAAAAYNAGPKRIEEWLALRKPLPQETQAYVRIITGRSAQEWAATGAGIWNAVRLPGPCARLASLVAHRTQTPIAPRQPQQPAHVAVATHQAERAARAIVAAHKTTGPAAPARQADRIVVAAHQPQNTHCCRLPAHEIKPVHLASNTAVGKTSAREKSGTAASSKSAHAAAQTASGTRRPSAEASHAPRHEQPAASHRRPTPGARAARLA
jgi:Transglycosylase SLT domain